MAKYLSDEYKINYFDLEQKVYEYSMAFFKEAVPYFNMYIPDLSRYINDDVLPLYCFDEMEEVMKAVQDNKSQYIAGGFVKGNRQSVIRIAISGRSGRLTKSLKQIVRHEIIHYLLWLIDRGFNDDDLDFWIYASIFDARPYKRLNKSDKEKYEQIMRLYNNHIKEQPYVVQTYVTQALMRRIEESVIGLEEFVLNSVDYYRNEIFKIS